MSFCVEETCSEDLEYDHHTGEQFLAKTHVLYPSRAAGRPEMESIHELPFGIYTVYRETRTALCSGQPILSGIGIRAIVTEDGAQILHSLRFMGNNAAHEVKAHTLEELNIAFGVVEYLLRGVYVMPKQASKLPK